MPNHVYNAMTLVGSPESIDSFIAKASAPYQTNFKEFDYVNSEYIISHTPSTHQSPLSFWNFVRPEDDILDIYFRIVEDPKKSKNITFDPMVILEEFGTLDDSFHWNARNWGTKWDAYDVEFSVTEEAFTSAGMKQVLYRFSTAWSPAEQALESMAEQHPDIIFSLEYEEESGWGGEISYILGELSSYSEYESAASHQDFIDRGAECDSCEDGNDVMEMFKDCPARVEESKRVESLWRSLNV